MALLDSPRRLGSCIALTLLALWGCKDPEQPQIVSARFVDEDHDGSIDASETILVELDRPLRDGDLDELTVELDPLVPWSCRVAATRRAEFLLEIESIDSSRAPQVEGAYGVDDGATGLRIGFGVALPAAAVDLEYLPSHPVLERVFWEEPAAGRNLTVDEGDALRLVFDRPVSLEKDPRARKRPLRVPEDLRLSRTTDQLDDGNEPARFERAQSPRELLVRLGSRPLLTIDPLSETRGSALLPLPSALSVNGTRIFPMMRIVDARGGWGAISTREVPIEFAAGFPRAARLEDAEFPPPGDRIFHTVTPISGVRALVIGGQDDTETATDQILVFDPAAGDFGRRILEEARTITPGAAESERVRLPSPAAEHTTTVLAGPDGEPGTDDDLVVVVGGRDADDQALGSITILRVASTGEGVSVTVLRPMAVKPPQGGGYAPGAGPLDRTGAGEVELEPAALSVPRWGHSSAAVSPLKMLVDGGRTRGQGRSGLVGCAELLSFEVGPDGVRLEEHTVFRSIPRLYHSLTSVPGSGERYVLAYGGYGEYRLQDAFLFQRSQSLGQPLDKRLLEEGRQPEIYFTDPVFGTVLVSPVLFDLEDPTKSFVLPYHFRFSLLRWGHVAVPLSGDRILIAGGTSAHLETATRSKQRGWEIPIDRERFDQELLRRLLSGLPVTPRGFEAGNAVLFSFDAQRPDRSRFAVLPHPAPDSQLPERIRPAHAVVPGIGVLFLGGEQADATPGAAGLRSGDIFLEGRGTWGPLAPTLTLPRWGHQAFVSSSGGFPTVFVIGGQPNRGEESRFAAVEALPLRSGSP